MILGDSDAGSTVFRSKLVDSFINVAGTYPTCQEVLTDNIGRMIGILMWYSV